MGESQWIGSADGGHARAEPDRIDRSRNVKRSGCAEEADPFLFAVFNIVLSVAGRELAAAKATANAGNLASARMTGLQAGGRGIL